MKFNEISIQTFPRNNRVYQGLKDFTKEEIERLIVIHKAAHITHKANGRKLPNNGLLVWRNKHENSRTPRK